MVYDVVIIGGGQAGLSLGYYLKKTLDNFVILDNQCRVGDVWRNRYDSLVLFTPRSYSSLPGLDLDGEPNGFPTKDEIADYLEQYSKHFNLPVRLHTEVKRVIKVNDTFKIITQNTLIEARKVVIATGPFQIPRIPSISNELSKDVLQLHSSQYKNPSQLNKGSVLVVGGGNSGSQIAVELSEFKETYLSIGQRIRFLPTEINNKSIFWIMEKLGVLNKSRDSFIGSIMRKQGDPIFGYELKEKLKLGTVKLKGRTKNVSGFEILFEDDMPIQVNNVIWATGFTSNYSFIEIPGVTDSVGLVIHKRGITDVEGLYFLGLPWQHRRGSSLILGIGHDAEYLCKEICK